MEGDIFLKYKTRKYSNREEVDRLLCIVTESGQNSWDLASYIKVRRGMSDLSLNLPHIHQTLAT
jgi:hypothetical protein